MLTIKQVIFRETIIAVIANVLLGGLGTYLALPKEAVLPLFGGPESAGFALFPASVGFPLFVTMMVTFGLRKKVASGAIGVSSKQPVNWLPKNTLLAAILGAAVCALVIAPIVLVFIWLNFGAEVSYVTAMAFNIIYLAVLAIFLLPIIVFRALNL